MKISQFAAQSFGAGLIIFFNGVGFLGSYLLTHFLWRALSFVLNVTQTHRRFRLRTQIEMKLTASRRCNPDKAMSLIHTDNGPSFRDVRAVAAGPDF